MASVLSLLLLLAAPQNVAFNENFDLGAFPPAGWSQQKANPSSSGWKKHTTSLRAWHEDEPLAVGTCDDLLVSPPFSLAGFAEAFVHVDVELRYPDFLANHPYSQADGETTVLMRSGGSWEPLWTDCRTSAGRASFTSRVPQQFLGAAAVELALYYHGTYAHETWIDLVQVDDARVAPGGGGGGVQWPGVVLPSAFLAAPFSEDFEAHAGVPPAWMALSALNASTAAPDPQAWCSIAGGTVASHSGVRHLEMGLQPGSTNYHNVRNALVIGVQGSAAPSWRLDFWVQDYGEENNGFDGVWVSVDGILWQQVHGTWGGYSSSWSSVSNLDLNASGLRLDGNFYLMFAQEDNYPYANLDGVSVDDVVVHPAAGGGCGLDVAMVGTCPGRATLEILDARPGSRVVLVYGAPGSFTWTGTPCSGLTFGIAAPSIGASFDPANAVNCLPVVLPTRACGVAVQAVDLDACCVGGVKIL